MAQNGPTDYAQIQQDEIDVLKAVFMEDFEEEEIKAVAWNKKADRMFKLKLWPSERVHEHEELFVKLSVALPTAYPKQAPRCDIDFGSSVSQKFRQSIKNLVPRKAQALIGSEAIYEIALSVQEELDAALTALTQTKSLPALDQERIERQEQAELEAEVARQEQQKALDHAQKARDNERSVAIGKEIQAQKIAERNMFASPPRTSLSDDRNVMTFDTEMQARAPSGALIAFRSVRIPIPFDNGPATYVSNTVPANSSDADAPKLVVKACEVGKGWKEDDLKQELSNILETGLRKLTRLSGHRHVLQVLGYRIQTAFTAGHERIWTVDVLNPFIKQGSLHAVLEQWGPFSIPTFKRINWQILEGLEYLHGKQIFHGRLTTENILLEKKANGLDVKITDMFYQAELHHLKNPKLANGFPDAPPPWQPPEASGLSGATRETDSWQMGVLMLKMILGIDVHDKHVSPLRIKDDIALTGPFETLLDKIFQSPPERRPTPFTLQSDYFVREESVLALAQDESAVLSRVPSETISQTPKVSRARLGSHGQPQASKDGTSRYTQDFTQYERVGKGGFGSVFKARHKTDGQTYAVKKIVSRSNEAFQGVLSEVMLLSRLYHPHIVRYITAWTEQAELDRTTDPESDEDTESEEDTEGQSSQLLSRSKPSLSTRAMDFISSRAGNDTDESDDSDDDEDVAPESASDAGSDPFERGDAQTTDEQDVDIIFGTSDNGDQVSDSSNTPATPKLPLQTAQRARRRSSAAAEAPSKVTLYIQMEFCENQTLRDVIRSNLSRSPDEYWRYLRQLTAALAYVHSSNIIHRDLKPENIFVNRGSIRLGDFGLAKPQVKGRQKGRSGGYLGSMTASIGTSVYIAPEVHSSGGGTYDEKADMYSLGIIMFEMCCSPRDTSMERYQTLQDLREEPPVFPNDFDKASRALEEVIISSLLNHKPNQRPTASELLLKFPPEVDGEAIKQTIVKTIAEGDENDPTFQQITKEYFTRPTDGREARYYTYDVSQNKHSASPDEAFSLSSIKKKLIHVFERHGAIESDRQSFVPSTDYWPDAVKVMDESGQLLHLPYDLTLPGARLLAKLSSDATIIPCKSYAIGPVFRRNTRPAQHPITSIEIDFDIISEDCLDNARREAETLQVMNEIIDAIPALAISPMCFHLSHSDLLDAILRFCKIPVAKMRPVKDLISRLGNRTFTQVRAELRGPELALSSTSLDDLQRFDFRDSFDGSINKLREIMGDDEKLEPIFNHLRAVFTYTKGRLNRKVWISPLSCHSAPFYSGGLMFQCLLDRKRRAVLCAGGRYDSLIREHASDRSRPPCFAVGFQLSWEALTNIVQKYKSNADKGKETQNPILRRCDVLVDSNDDELLRREGCDVLAELWKEDIRAELASDVGNPEKNKTYHGQKLSHDWHVLVKKDGVLRIRNLIRGEEDEVPRGELISHLRSEIRERDRDKRHTERPPLYHAISEGATGDDRPQLDVKVLVSQTRSKKTNRQAIVNEAQQLAQEPLSKFLSKSGSIVAVELKDESFESIRGLRVDDGEAWRKAIQHAESNARSYMTQIHDELKGMARTADGGRSALLYNFRSKAFMTYDLTKSK